jgi:hypothetical protein
MQVGMAHTPQYAMSICTSREPGARRSMSIAWSGWSAAWAP